MRKDPSAPIPFAAAPHGAVKSFTRTTPGGTRIQYLRFNAYGDRTYAVEIPRSMVKAPRSKDDWMTLFSAYGRDPAAEADITFVTGQGYQDLFGVWITRQISNKATQVAQLRSNIAVRVVLVMQWAVVHRDAKVNNDPIKAQSAWREIAIQKRDLLKMVPELAKSKLSLGKLYSQAGAYDQARLQYTQTAGLKIFPYSAEAIAKLRGLEGATPSAISFTTPAAIGQEWISSSDIYTAAQVAATATSP